MKGGNLIPCDENPSFFTSKFTSKQTIDVAWNAGKFTKDVLMKALLVICVTFKRFVNKRNKRNKTKELFKFESNDVLDAFNSSSENESVKHDYKYVLGILTTEFNLNSEIIKVNMCQLMKALYYAAMYIQSNNDKQIPTFTFQKQSDWIEIYNKYKTVFETDQKTSKHFASIVPDLKIPDRYAEVAHKELETLFEGIGLTQNETIKVDSNIAVAENDNNVNFNDDVAAYENKVYSNIAVAENENNVNLNDTVSDGQPMSFREAEKMRVQRQQQKKKEFETFGFTHAEDGEGP